MALWRTIGLVTFLCRVSVLIGLPSPFNNQWPILYILIKVKWSFVNLGAGVHAFHNTLIPRPVAGLSLVYGGSHIKDRRESEVFVQFWGESNMKGNKGTTI